VDTDTTVNKAQLLPAIKDLGLMTESDVRGYYGLSRLIEAWKGAHYLQIWLPESGGNTVSLNYLGKSTWGDGFIKFENLSFDRIITIITKYSEIKPYRDLVMSLTI